MKKAVVVCLFIFAALSFAQLDPTGISIGAAFDLYESGNKVGEIYVPGRDAYATHYLEHWVLFPGYVYPGPKSLTKLKIVPKSTSPYANESDFFKRVGFEAGSKYIRVTSDESPVLPAVLGKEKIMQNAMVVCLLMFAALSFAQLDPIGGSIGAAFDLYESGNKVGEIYVPGRDAFATHYLEHWVLFPGYVYPGPKSLTKLKIVPKSTSPYANEGDFFKRVAFEPAASTSG